MRMTTDRLYSLPNQPIKIIALLGVAGLCVYAWPTTTSRVMCKTPVLSLAVVPDPTPPSTAATLSWSAVTQNTNDSAYTDPFGYVINYGTAVDQLVQYGIHADGSVVLFAGERRFPIGDVKMLTAVETAYWTAMAKLDQRYEGMVDGRELKFERVRAVSP